MNINFQRNGRLWINKLGKKEEVLDIFSNEEKLGRGICYQVFSRVLGIKFKKGEYKTFQITEIKKEI